MIEQAMFYGLLFVLVMLGLLGMVSALVKASRKLDDDIRTRAWNRGHEDEEKNE